MEGKKYFAQINFHIFAGSWSIPESLFPWSPTKENFCFYTYVSKKNHKAALRISVKFVDNKKYPQILAGIMLPEKKLQAPRAWPLDVNGPDYITLCEKIFGIYFEKLVWFITIFSWYHIRNNISQKNRKPWTIVAKNSILDLRQGSEYASEFLEFLQNEKIPVEVLTDLCILPCVKPPLSNIGLFSICLRCTPGPIKDCKTPPSRHLHVQS